MTALSMPAEPTAADPMPQPPRQPDAFDCCGNECGEACVWTIYEHAKEKYQADLEAWQIRQLLSEDD
ncbi:MAG: oxidoreductase-like domain-containing protein [Rhodocyclaceae bacterium]